MKKSKAKSSAPKIDPYVEGFLSKLLDRLLNLERKMDTVLSHTGRLAASGGGKVPQSQPAPQLQAPPRRERQMYEAICADCSKVCEVPFQPSEDRAVYCKECWAQRKAGRHGSSTPHGMPILKPVSLPPRPQSERPVAAQFVTPPSAATPAKKAKKSAPAKIKKAKKKR